MASNGLTNRRGLRTNRGSRRSNRRNYGSDPFFTPPAGRSRSDIYTQQQMRFLGPLQSQGHTGYQGHIGDQEPIEYQGTQGLLTPEGLIGSQGIAGHQDPAPPRRLIPPPGLEQQIFAGTHGNNTPSPGFEHETYPPGSSSNMIPPPGFERQNYPPGSRNMLPPPGFEHQTYPPSNRNMLPPPGFEHQTYPPNNSNTMPPPGFENQPYPPNLDNIVPPPGIENMPYPPADTPRCPFGTDPLSRHEAYLAKLALDETPPEMTIRRAMIMADHKYGAWHYLNPGLPSGAIGLNEPPKQNTTRKSTETNPADSEELPSRDRNNLPKPSGMSRDEILRSRQRLGLATTAATNNTSDSSRMPQARKDNTSDSSRMPQARKDNMPDPIGMRRHVLQPRQHPVGTNNTADGSPLPRTRTDKMPELTSMEREVLQSLHLPTDHITTAHDLNMPNPGKDNISELTDMLRDSSLSRQPTGVPGPAVPDAAEIQRRVRQNSMGAASHRPVFGPVPPPPQAATRITTAAPSPEDENVVRLRKRLEVLTDSFTPELALDSALFLCITQVIKDMGFFVTPENVHQALKEEWYRNQAADKKKELEAQATMDKDMQEHGAELMRSIEKDDE